jgi:hypothetical protein
MGVIEQLDGPYGIGRDDARGEGRRLLVVDGACVYVAARIISTSGTARLPQPSLP